MGIDFDAETADLPGEGQRAGKSTEWHGGPERLPFKTIPRELDGYRIDEEIARGGMGVVFRAHDTKRDRAVAVKFMLSGGKASEAERERFQREGRALAQVRDPNIVALRGHGEYEGMPYLVMDLIDGESLQDRLDRKGPMSSRRAAEVTRRLALALEAAHERGIIHRDIKPDNVLLNQKREPMLTDFGLAAGQNDMTRQLTRTGAALGTPGYWAPEQVRGKREKLGPHTDVWGLGATLYAMLTGVPPFDGTSLYDIMSATLEDAPTAPRALKPGVDPDLERICLRCLEKDPARRYEDTAELADDLERFARQHRKKPSGDRASDSGGIAPPPRPKRPDRPAQETARLPPPRPEPEPEPEPPFPLGAMLLGGLVLALLAFAFWRGERQDDPLPEATPTEVAAINDDADDRALPEPDPGLTPTRGPAPDGASSLVGTLDDPSLDGPPGPSPTGPPRGPTNTGPPGGPRSTYRSVPKPRAPGLPGAPYLSDTVRLTRSATGSTIDRYGRRLGDKLKLRFNRTEVQVQRVSAKPGDPLVEGRGFQVRLDNGRLLATRLQFPDQDAALYYFGYALNPDAGALVVAELRGRQVQFLVGDALRDIDFARTALAHAWRTKPSIRPTPTTLAAIAVLNVRVQQSFGSRVFVPRGPLRKAAWNSVAAGRKRVKDPVKGMKVEFLDDAQTHLWFETKHACSEVRWSSKACSVLFGPTRDGVAETNAYLLKLARKVR